MDQAPTSSQPNPPLPGIPGRLKSLRRRRLAAVLGIPAFILLSAVLDSAFNVPEWLGMVLASLFLADLVLIIVFNGQVRRAQKSELLGAGVSERSVPSLRTSLILAGFWFLFDAFFVQQGLISLVIILLCLLWMVPATILARKDIPLMSFRAGRAAAYFLAAAAALGVIQINAGLAERRAEVVVKAVRQYQQKYGRYPQHLQEVTPEFLPSVPRARYSLMWNDFMYFQSSEGVLLYYVVLPPFARKVYNFKSGTWGQLD